MNIQRGSICVSKSTESEQNLGALVSRGLQGDEGMEQQVAVATYEYNSIHT